MPKVSKKKSKLHPFLWEWLVNGNKKKPILSDLHVQVIQTDRMPTTELNSGLQKQNALTKFDFIVTDGEYYMPVVFSTRNIKTIPAHHDIIKIRNYKVTTQQGEDVFTTKLFKIVKENSKKKYKDNIQDINGLIKQREMQKSLNALQNQQLALLQVQSKMIGKPSTESTPKNKDTMNDEHKDEKKKDITSREQSPEIQVGDYAEDVGEEEDELVEETHMDDDDVEPDDITVSTMLSSSNKQHPLPLSQTIGEPSPQIDINPLSPETDPLDETPVTSYRRPTTTPSSLPDKIPDTPEMNEEEEDVVPPSPEFNSIMEDDETPSSSPYQRVAPPPQHDQPMNDDEDEDEDGAFELSESLIHKNREHQTHVFSWRHFYLYDMTLDDMIVENPYPLAHTFALLSVDAPSSPKFVPQPTSPRPFRWAATTKPTNVPSRSTKPTNVPSRSTTKSQKPRALANGSTATTTDKKRPPLSQDLLDLFPSSVNLHHYAPLKPSSGSMPTFS